MINVGLAKGFFIEDETITIVVKWAQEALIQQPIQPDASVTHLNERVTI